MIWYRWNHFRHFPKKLLIRISSSGESSAYLGLAEHGQNGRPWSRGDCPEECNRSVTGQDSHRFESVWIRWKQHFSCGPCGLAVIEKSLRRDISQEFDNKRIEAGQGPGRRHRLSQLYRSLYEFVWNGLVTLCLGSDCVSLCQISSFHCIPRPRVFGPWRSLVGWFHPPMMH